MSLLSIFGKLVLTHIPVLPDLDILERKKNAVLGRWPDVVVTPPEKDRERLVQEMLRRLNANEWDDTPMLFVTSAARALFDAERRERPDLSNLRDFYYEETRASTRRSFLDAMLSVYLTSYQPGAAHTQALASALSSAWAGIGAQGRSLRDNIPEVLDPAAAPRAVAAKMRGMEDCWNGLKAIGLRLPHAPGLMDHAHLAFVELMRPALKSRPALEQLFNWLKPEGQQARMSGAAEAIAAVIEPWLNRDPHQDDLAFITEPLVSLYGDPRVLNGGAWAGVPREHRGVLVRWLTGENIRFFLDVISTVETSHMFAPRRAFWLSLHEQKRIDAAWVAFSDSGFRLARRLRQGSGEGALEFGRQTAGGNRKDTSLLIMQIGKRIVVEGSHDYKVHIFKDGNEQKPRLFLAEYNCEEIRLRSDENYPHVPTKWRDWVRERI